MEMFLVFGVIAVFVLIMLYSGAIVRDAQNAQIELNGNQLELNASLIKVNKQQSERLDMHLDMLKMQSARIEQIEKDRNNLESKIYHIMNEIERADEDEQESDEIS